MTPLRTMVAAVVTGAAVWTLAVGSGVASRWHADNAAVLRVSWSMRPERLEHCRRLSKSEIEALPEHMRTTVACDGRFATYDLRVTIDDAVHDASVVHGSGIRRDRPMFLLRNYPTADGAHRVRVQLVRRESPDTVRSTTKAEPVATDSGPSTARAARDDEQRRELALYAIPERMVLDTLITFQSGKVVLVTYADRALVVRTR